MSIDSITSLIPKSWQALLHNCTQSAEFKSLAIRLSAAYEEQTVYPPKAQLFRALELCPPEKCRIILIGQDPYHGPNQANGLAFSVPDKLALPPSLRNIFTEIKSDIGIENQSGNLESWARQGVLLLNTSLSVEAHKAGSHSKWGWWPFTSCLVSELSKMPGQQIYVLWGKHAQKLKAHIAPGNLLLESAHPSPLSAYRGFFGSKVFSQINEALRQMGQEPVDWSTE